MANNLCKSIDLNTKCKYLPGLSLIATPIGNLGDITLRAIETLKSVDFIACEDTRHTRKLLTHYGISSNLLTYHEHNAQKMRPYLLKLLTAEKSVALVSDAGTPLIADPGYKLVQDCYQHEIAVTHIPGPCSPIVALTLSGFPGDRFCFAGFLPPKSKARQSFLLQFGAIHGSLIFFESPRRLLASLQDMQTVWGDVEVAMVRELTKKFEEVRRAKLSELVQDLTNQGGVKGEVILVVDGRSLASPEQIQLDALLNMLLPKLSLKESVEFVVCATGLGKRTVYHRALEIQEGLK